MGDGWHTRMLPEKGSHGGYECLKIYKDESEELEMFYHGRKEVMTIFRLFHEEFLASMAGK